MTEHDKPAANVVEALCRVMAELPAIGKDGRADPKQGGYAYRGIEQITREAQPLFAKHGVLFGIPRVVSYEVRDITVNSKPWTDVYEMVEYDVYGPGGLEDKLTVGPILAIGRDNSDKGGNKCLTQAYKYALLQAFTISDSKDDGDHASVEAEHGPEGITSEVLFDRLTQYVAGRTNDPNGEHAKGAWKAAKPKKAEDGLIYETEVGRVIAAAERYVVDLEELNQPEQPELVS